ncbi:MAG TPA: VpsR-related response regulator [Burkholderiales bacterium]|nr:VpsR-related response regulator [Burkholderiales bacterium]
MGQEKRHLLYVDFSLQGELEAGEELSDWEIHSVNTLDKARRLLQQHAFRVGMVRLERGFEERASEAVGALTQVSRFVEWIGLVPAGALSEGDGRLTRIIAEHFFDYHTLPLSGGRLRQTLGHAWGMSQALEHTARAGHSVAVSDEEMVGTSPAMQELFRGIRTQMLPLSQVRAAVEREAVQHALRLCGNNLSEVARKLCISRVTLYNLLEKHGLGNVERRNCRNAHDTPAAPRFPASSWLSLLLPEFAGDWRKTGTE